MISKTQHEQDDKNATSSVLFSSSMVLDIDIVEQQVAVDMHSPLGMSLGADDG